MFNPWLGQFVVIKRVDNDSYLISPIDDRRKTYLVYRGRLRLLSRKSGSPVISEQNDACPDKSSLKIGEQSHKVESEVSKLKRPSVEPNVEKPKKYNLRSRSDVDYRQFY